MSDRPLLPSFRTPLFISDLLIPIRNLPHLFRTSGPDISPATFKRFFSAKSNKERFGSIALAILLNPNVFRDLTLSADGPVRALANGKVIFIRDFDVFIEANAKLGHRGDAVVALHYKWAPYDAFSPQPAKYPGECPYGKWEIYKEINAVMNSTARLSEQTVMMEAVIDQYMSKIVGKTGEIGELLRQLVWDLFTVAMYGVWPNYETKKLSDEYQANQQEFDYAVRMKGLKVDYEWSDQLQLSLKRRTDWGMRTVEERIENIEKYQHQGDVLTDNVMNHPYKKYELEGQLRGCYSGGGNNSHSSICCMLINNALSDNEAVHHYLMQNPEQNAKNIVKESLRLATHTPLTRIVQEQDDFVVEGKKLSPGTTVFWSTYAVSTDPRVWEDPLKFDPSRFEGDRKRYGFMTETGLAPFGTHLPDLGLGGRSCSGRVFSENLLRTAMTKLLKDYKFVALGGGRFEFQNNSGVTRYKGHCMVRVEKRT